MSFQTNLTLSGPGLAGGNTAEPTSFTISAQGSPLPKDAFRVEITSPAGAQVASQLTANGDGTFTVTYQPPIAGHYEVNVYMKSNVKVGIAVGTDASKTRVFGPGLEDGVQDNLPTYFTIEARGTDGNPMGKGGDPFQVKITGPKGNVPATVTDNGDGTYRVDYAPEDAGNHKIEVTLKEKPVANSPYTVNVREGADHNTSCVEDCQFTIRAKTKRGVFMGIGGEKFGASVKGPQGEADIDVKDNNNGSYTVTYPAPTQHGDYTFRAYLKQLLLKKDIKNSPWTEHHD